MNTQGKDPIAALAGYVFNKQLPTRAVWHEAATLYDLKVECLLAKGRFFKPDPSEQWDNRRQPS